MCFLYMYTYLMFIIFKIFMNYNTFNQYTYMYLNYYTTMLNFNTLNMWFMLFMFIVFLNVFYFLSKKMYSMSKFYNMMFLYFVLYYMIMMLFLSDDCILFIFCFEFMLFIILSTTMYFMFSNSFIIAIYYLIIFSIISGMLCFSFLFILFSNMNVSSFILYINVIAFNDINITILMWCMVYVIFGIKFPMYPFYFWLLAVHVEVSSEMSTLLAAIILKSGFIGMLKFLVIMMCYLTYILSILSGLLIIVGLFSCNMNLLIITDYKKIMGTWSMLHVNVTLLFMWYNNTMFLLLFLLSNLGHMMSSSSFFLCISFNYENFNNKHIFMMSSCFNFNMYSFLFIFLILNNIDFPFFLLFYVELLNFFAMIFMSNYLLLMLVLTVLMLFTSSLLLYFVLNFYYVKWNNTYMRFDMNISEFMLFFMLLTYNLILYWQISMF